MSDSLQAGAANCVVDCAGVRRGARVMLVNEAGAVDEPVVAAIADAVRSAGADVAATWADPIPKETPAAIPEAVLAAYREGEIVVSHFPSLAREALHPHFPRERRVRVPNRARTESLLGSDWAQFPYSVQRAIADALEARMAPGRSWRITGPAGTDIAGVFADSGGEVGAAYFVEGDGGRARRNFPGGVHDPRACAEMRGVVAVEYIDDVPQSAAEPPLRIEVKDNRIVAMSGGDGEGRLHAAVAASDRWIDSWHAGVNPRTVVPIARDDNSRTWFGFSHCSPAVMHFHLGRGHAATNLGCFGHTLVVDGETLYADGRLTIFDDKAVARAILESEMPESMLSNREIAFW